MSSSQPPILVEVASPTDYPSIAALQRVAFNSALLHQRVFGDVTDQDMDDWVLARLTGAMNSHKGAPQVLKVMRGSEIIACAVWRAAWLDIASEGEKGGKPEEEKKKERMPKYPRGTNEELADQIFREQSGGLEKEKKHWYLSTLATHPQLQKTGAGTALLKWGCDKADQAGVPSYLKATLSKSTPQLQEDMIEAESENLQRVCRYMSALAL
ncbi:hypothetical protein P7C70_g2551, partial [Phenoliferia sp. Uapishka_3]